MAVLLSKVWKWLSDPVNLGVIGSLASIIGLPIALWQMKDVKTKVQAYQNAVNRMVDFLKYEKLDNILQRLKDVHDSFIKLKGRMKERGHNEESINKSINDLIIELNHCDHDLPTGFNNVTEAIREVIEKMEQLQQTNVQKDKLIETEDSIRKAIGIMKIVIDEGDKAKLCASSKQ